MRIVETAQVLELCTSSTLQEEAKSGFMSLTSQLKAGKGLTLLVECVKGDFNENAELADDAKTVSPRLFGAFFVEKCW